jgi:small-conductance mechanosensitive channel
MESLAELFSKEFLVSLLHAVIIIGIGIPLIYLLAKWIGKQIAERVSPQRAMITNKLVRYLGFSIIILMVLKEFGFSLGPLLGAAGIIGIAVGFASQTSVSNIISGVFLLAERPFVVGDVIQIGGTIGQVLSIDTLSVKLRTFDNKFVRIPNETMIKSEVVNITKFPIRRLDVNISVAYKENIAHVRKILMEIAEKNDLCLQEPKPMIIFSGFSNSSVDLLFAVWAAKENFLKLKNTIQEEIKKGFDQEGVEIPFPHISLYKGSASAPFPVQIIPPDKAPEETIIDE